MWKWSVYETGDHLQISVDWKDGALQHMMFLIHRCIYNSYYCTWQISGNWWVPIFIRVKTCSHHTILVDARRYALKSESSSHPWFPVPPVTPVVCMYFLRSNTSTFKHIWMCMCQSKSFYFYTSIVYLVHSVLYPTWFGLTIYFRNYSILVHMGQLHSFFIAAEYSVWGCTIIYLMSVLLMNI